MAAGELATLYVSIVASARGLRDSVKKELTGAERDAQATGSRAGDAYSSGFGATVGKVGSILSKTLAVGAGAAMTAVGAAGAVGIKTAAQLENANIAFTTMLGSGEKAKAFMGDLSKFAAQTPFELPGLQQSASQLIAAGIDAKKVIPIMTTLGNATSGMGTGAEGIQRAVVAIQQMNAAQKISAEDLNQLRDAGIPVYDLLAAATGKTKEQIAGMVQAGKLGKTELDQLMKALESGVGMERFSGMMEKQSQSLAGLWSTMKDTFSIGMAQAIEPVIPLIKDGLGGASNLLAAILPKVAAGLKETVGGVVAFGAAWKANDGDITSSGFPGFMERVAYLIHQAFDAGDRVVGVFFNALLHGTAAFANGAPPVINFLNILGGSLHDAFERLAPVIAPLIPQFKDAWTSVSPLSIAFQSLVDVIPDLVTIAAQLLETFAKMTSSGLDALQPVLSGVSDTISNAVSPAMEGLTGFFADNETASNLLAGAIIGTKLAMEGYQIATKIATAVSAAWKTITSIITGVQVGYSAALGISTAMTQAQAAATERGTAGYIAMKVAQVATAAWTGIVTAAQWAWNAALSANPIALIIIAIAALVAGLVWFFTQTELGRQIIQNVWAAIQVAIGTVINWFTGTVVPAFQAAVKWVGDAVQWLYQNVIKPVFENLIAPAIDAFGRVASMVFQIVTAIIQKVIGPAIFWFHDSVVKPVFDAIGGVFTWIFENIIKPTFDGWVRIFTVIIPGAINWLYSNVIKPVFDGIGAAISWVYNNVIKPTLMAWDWYLKNVLAPALNWLWQNVIRPVWDGIGGAIKWVWDNVISPVFSTVRNAIEKDVPNAFKTGVDLVKKWWDGLVEVAKTPVRFAVKAINDGLVHPLNAVASILGIKDALPDVALPPGFATGGWTGPGSKYQPAGIVHADEFVFTKEQVGAAGGPGAMYALARAITRGYAAGGLVSPLDHWTLTQGYSGAHNGLDMAAPQGTPIHAAGPGIVSFAGWGYGGLGGNEMHIDHPNGLQTWYAHQSSFAVPQGTVVSQGQLVGYVGMSGAATGPHLHYMVLHGGWPNYTDPTPYLTGGGEDGGVHGGGAFNPIAGFISGVMDAIKGAFPGSAFMVDLVGGAAQSLVKSVSDWVTNKIFGVQDAPNGSSTTFDGGGWLERTVGPQLVQHNTTRPDAVLSDGQWRTMTKIADGAAGGSELQGNLYLDSGEFLGVVRGVVSKQVDAEARDATRRRMGV